jgi:hypothetical protein
MNTESRIIARDAAEAETKLAAIKVLREDWTSYTERQPEGKGVFAWRVPNRSQPNLIIQFFAHMRERGAGYRQAISPSFDYWNGSRILVPDGTEWREAPDAPAGLKDYDAKLICLEGPEPLPCPFCKEKPRWRGLRRASDGGLLIGANPHEFNRWWLECCAWAKSPQSDDPIKLNADRSALLTALEASQ